MALPISQLQRRRFRFAELSRDPFELHLRAFQGPCGLAITNGALKRWLLGPSDEFEFNPRRRRPCLDSVTRRKQWRLRVRQLRRRPRFRLAELTRDSYDFILARSKDLLREEL